MLCPFPFLFRVPFPSFPKKCCVPFPIGVPFPIAINEYASTGFVPIDNNAIERLMKQVALGRKNWLFVGNVSAEGEARC